MIPKEDFGGAIQSRTGLDGFAIRCIGVLPLHQQYRNQEVSLRLWVWFVSVLRFKKDRKRTSEDTSSLASVKPTTSCLSGFACAYWVLGYRLQNPTQPTPTVPPPPTFLNGSPCEHLYCVSLKRFKNSKISFKSGESEGHQIQCPTTRYQSEHLRLR